MTPWDVARAVFQLHEGRGGWAGLAQGCPGPLTFNGWMDGSTSTSDSYVMADLCGLATAVPCMPPWSWGQILA